MRPKRSVMCAAKSSPTSGCLTKVNVTMPYRVMTVDAQVHRRYYRR